ncbi:SDR family oxidoreductase [Marinobacterium arenosum]|uniref:SDR family oxidoreductase n=1 Tax=Marinobacterium arenosum TaxID=2862496 RepID=UPI001C95C7AA|nr:SDR family oxidoreductase [Marinobacterium arenosum]MBY4677311.1 SDR family oxidoreductase [Marinobacterium arenosum]
MPTILITGANRGIGQALAHSYLRDGWRVLATRRGPDSALPDGVEPLPLDVGDGDSIAALKAQLAGEPIDLLWNNAGVYLDKNLSLAQLSDRDWLRTFQINSIAPIRIAEALAENVAASQRKVMAFTTSKMGSLAGNGAGAYAYRASKTALNMAVRCFANDYRAAGISCLLLHPGHVQTDMGGPQGAIDVATSVAGMRTLVDRVTPAVQAQFSGGFFDYDGSPIPW